MAKKIITDSLDISILESKIVTDTCLGNFLIDLTPSVYIASGATLVLGAKISIINPYGVEVKTFPVGYDISAPMTGVVTFPIPTQSGNFQYGLYSIKIELTDAANKKFIIEENTKVCEPNPLDKTKKYGNLTASITGNCKSGRVVVQVNEPPVYNGVVSESKTTSYILNYPTSSTLPPYTSTQQAFSVQLYEGEYLLKGDACVTYNYGNNNFAKVPYKVNCKKNILCLVDLCCVYDKLAEINNELSSSCDDARKKELSNTIVDALFLLKTIELGADCGEDVSENIEQLESLLKCSCTCKSADGTPIVNNTPSRDVVITGRNVIKTVVGLTDSYLINNDTYRITTNPANSFLTISSPVLNGIEVTQELTFNVALLYTEIKGLIVNTTEYNYWSGVINNTLNGLPQNLLNCIGLTSPQWDALTFRDKILTMLTKTCNCCGSSSCNAVVSNNSTSSQGQFTMIDWDIDVNTHSTDLFVDNVFVATLLNPVSSYQLAGYNNGVMHTYKLIAKCSSGTSGNMITGTFNNVGCPTILAPNLATNNVPSAACPFNLGTISPVTPVGLELEWHNENNTLDTTLVPNPAAISSGTYFAFYKESSSGCYSPSSQVIVTCLVAGNCTEPLGLNVSRGAGIQNIVTFNSASTPPPSYLVKRRLASDPDVSGSYTTLGTPVFNAGTNKWEITDSSATSNTLYVYKAESQCADATRPSAFFTFARIVCPSLTITPTVNSLGISFTNVGGQVDKYVVELYDSTGTVLLDTKTKLTPFGSPITDTFTGLTANTNYNIKTTAFIGTYSNTCGLQSTSTSAVNGNINIVSGILPVTQASNTASGTITGTAGSTVNVVLVCEGTDIAAVLNYNVDGNISSVNNATSGFTIPIVLPGGGSINWSITLTTTVGSQTGDIQLS